MRFALKALDATKQVVLIELEAADEAAARETARSRGCGVISVERKDFGFSRTKGFSATLFSIELLALLDAGLNIVEALQALAEKEEGGLSRNVLEGMLHGLRRGEAFSQATARYPDAFSPLYVATIKSSERTGSIQDALRRYVAYQEELDKVRKKLVSALLYPAILSVVGVLVLGFLLLYVVPRFARVYEEMSSSLPLFSALLLATGRWIEQNMTLLLSLVGIALVSGAYILSPREIRAALLAQIWRIPALGKRVRIYELARLYRTAGMLMRAGIPALRTFRMVSDLLQGNLQARLARATTMLQEGSPISAALTSTGLATPIATRMMAVGEKSGQMAEMMERIAKFYDEETARFVEAFTKVFEPVVMIVLGLAVGLVVVLMYMPIFELAGSVR
jgi:general secretion pathway protein F